MNFIKQQVIFGINTSQYTVLLQLEELNYMHLLKIKFIFHFQN